MSQFIIQRQRSIKLGHYNVITPTLWLGHDLDHQVRVWQRLPHCPGVMLNAYQLFSMPILRERAAKEGLHNLLGYQGPIFLDSGGFLFQRDGESKITAEELLSLYDQLKPDIAAILDVPLNPLESTSVNHRRWRATLKNTEFMFQNNGSVVLAPVFHAYQLDVIKPRQAQLQRITSNPPFICIGSLVPLLKASYIGRLFRQGDYDLSPTLQRWRFITRLILKVRCLYPTSIVHVFGVGSLSTMYLLYALGVDSVDSLSWRLKAAYGEILLPGLSNRCMKPRRSATRVRRTLRDKDIDLLLQCQCPACDHRTIEERVKILSDSFVARATHNAYVFLYELESIKAAIKARALSQLVTEKLEESSLFRRVVYSIILPELEKCSEDHEKYLEEA